ncbi:DNA polymerase III subunit delta, partial [Dysosmobacter welbionis]
HVRDHHQLTDGQPGEFQLQQLADDIRAARRGPLGEYQSQPYPHPGAAVQGRQDRVHRGEGMHPCNHVNGQGTDCHGVQAAHQQAASQQPPARQKQRHIDKDGQHSHRQDRHQGVHDLGQTRHAAHGDLVGGYEPVKCQGVDHCPQRDDTAAPHLLRHRSTPFLSDSVQQIHLPLLGVLLPQQGARRRETAHPVAALVGDGRVLQRLHRLQLVLWLQGHHRHPLGGAGGLGSQQSGVENQRPGLRGVHRQLAVCIQPADTGQGRLVGVGPRQLAAVGGGLVGGQVHPGRLAVCKEEQQGPGVVRSRQDGVDHILAAVHGEFRGQIVPQGAGLGVFKLAEAGLVHLAPVREEHD